ncbi:MAG: hypothetical protein ABS37_17950 [Acidovorax sp. SCN 65-108]|nr:MAG: hypothetical protein ABS37_17950 [Acidovorax sp. SCN 65-108]
MIEKPISTTGCHGLSLRAVGNEACRRLAHSRAIDAHGREAGDHGLGELDVSETDDGQLVGDRHGARPRLGEDPQGQHVGAAEHGIDVWLGGQQGRQTRTPFGVGGG